MKNYKRSTRLLLVAALSLATTALAVNPSSATGLVTKADLAGSWQMTLNGKTGCGLVSMLVTVTLNGAGSGTNAIVKTHGECGNSVLSGQSFQILTLASNGSGTANLSCGVGCGWNFNIQVSPDRSIFNAVDVDSANPGNFLSGMAIHQ